MNLYIIRHGEPDYQNDALTPHGEKQAEALSRRLATYRLNKIYSSPMGRAKKTAEPTCRLINLDYRVEEWMSELGKLMVKAPGDEYQRMAMGDASTVFRDKEHWGLGNDIWNSPHFLGAPVKEEYERVAICSDEFLNRHGYERKDGLYRILWENNENVAVFCHMWFGCTWLSHLLLIPPLIMWASLLLQTSSVTKVVFEGKKGEMTAPVCHYVSDISHLYAENLKPVL